MDTIQFISTKNNKVSASVNNIKLHSVYDPEKEAERFVENIFCSFSPAQIFITEPAVSYIIPFLRKKFPEAALTCVRYSEDFSRFNSGWDKIINYTDEEKFSEELNRMSEDLICSTLFLDWTPSSKAFFEINDKVWKIIKENILNARSLLFTRSFFAERWILNQINFVRYAKNIYTIQNGSQDILIAASGKSLESSIEKIKKFKDYFFIMCVSSALDVLLYNKIIPDLVISTDGGWWAQRHLDSLNKYNIPLAIASEGNCSKNFLEKLPLIPLDYAPENKNDVRLLEKCNIPYIIAERNGTVSGTALALAMKITTGNIYFAGLDLSCSKSFQHTQPNRLESLNSVKDFKFSPAQKRLTGAMFNSGSLKIYENWFKSNSNLYGNRTSRISENYRFSNNLNLIKDINFEDFEKRQKPSFDKIFIKKISEISDHEKNEKEIENFVNKLENNYEYQKNFFPAECIAILKEKDSELKEKKKNELTKKIKKIALKIRK